MKINWKEMAAAIAFSLVGIFFIWLSIYGIAKEKNIGDILFFGSMGIFCLIAGILWFVFTNDFFVVDHEETTKNFKKVLFKNKYLLVNMQTNMAYELPLEFFNKNLAYVKIRFCYDIKRNFKMEQFNLHDQVFID